MRSLQLGWCSSTVLSRAQAAWPLLLLCSVVSDTSWPMDSPGSSVHGIFPARILEQVAISFSRGSSWCRDRTYVTCIDRQILYHWDTREGHLPASAGDAGSVPGWGRSLGRGNSTPLQYSCLENPRDGGAWWAAISGVTQSRIRLKRLSSSGSSSSLNETQRISRLE